MTQKYAKIRIFEFPKDKNEMKKLLPLLLAALTLIPVQSLAKKNEGPASLTVMSYNIRNGEANDGTNSWQFRAPATAEMIMDQMPDVFGVQEAYLYQVKFIEEFCRGYKSVGVGRDDGKKKGEYMSIFYNKKKIKLLKWGTFWLSETPDKPSRGWDAACYRTATWALLRDKASGKEFFFVNTHLDHVGWDARREGLALIVNRIASINPKGLPMVLTGDFNMTPEREEFSPLKGKMESARDVAAVTDRLATFHAWGKEDKSIIDYIFISGFSSCLKYETVRKEYSGRKFVSDHYPIVAQILF